MSNWNDPSFFPQIKFPLTFHLPQDQMEEVIDHEAESAGTNTPAKIGDLQGIQASYRLNGKNYLKWSQVVRTFLKGKGKLRHLTGDSPAEDDPKFEAWDEEDSLIMSWLWNTMSPEISDTCMFLGTTREIWDTVKQTYSKVKDAAQIHELKTKINSAKQGNKSITEYATHLQSLWQELDHYQCIQMINADDVVTLKRVLEKDRIFAFLAGLNSELAAVRVQIMGKEKLHSLNEAISIVRAEEGRRGVMLNTTIEESSALAVKYNKGRNFEQGSKAQREEWIKVVNLQPRTPSKNTDKDSLYCTYCKKKRHNRENCWKLNGRGQKKEAAYDNVSHTEESKGQSSITSSLNITEIEKLKKLLETLEAPSKCTLALSEGTLAPQWLLPPQWRLWGKKCVKDFFQSLVRLTPSLRRIQSF